MYGLFILVIFCVWSVHFGLVHNGGYTPKLLQRLMHLKFCHLEDFTLHVTKILFSLHQFSGILTAVQCFKLFESVICGPVCASVGMNQ